MAVPSSRSEQIAAFYSARAKRVQRKVASHINATEQIIEDACQEAWASLLRRDDIALDDRGAAWLATVAIRKGWRLASIAREVPMGTFRAASTYHELEMPEPQSDEPGCGEQAIARTEDDQRRADFRVLKPRERRDLYLLALGFTYAEIAEAGDSSYTAVNRRLSEGRAKLRRLARERTDGA